jgi:hypothetical protein
VVFHGQTKEEKQQNIAKPKAPKKWLKSPRRVTQMEPLEYEEEDRGHTALYETQKEGTFSPGQGNETPRPETLKIFNEQAETPEE